MGFDCFSTGAEENLVVNNKDNRVFMCRNSQIVAPWKFDVLKTSIFAQYLSEPITTVEIDYPRLKIQLDARRAFTRPSY